MQSKDVLFIDSEKEKYLRQIHHQYSQENFNCGFNLYISPTYPDGYTENGESGIIQKIFEEIGTTNKVCLEIGAGDGLKYSVTADLRLNHQWKGYLVEGFVPVWNDETSAGASLESIQQAVQKNQDPNWNTHTQFIYTFVTQDNVNQVLKQVPDHLDFMSIDIDGNDFWIWRALKKNPRVVMIEYNSHIPPNIDASIIYQENYATKRKDKYCGCSILSLYHLGKKLGYQMIHGLSCNLFFVKNEDVAKITTPMPWINNVEAIYMMSSYYNNGKLSEISEKRIRKSNRYLHDLREWTETISLPLDSN